jgi:alpha-D-ribose 1-methylphosphonate 5-triphosphate synthase subunit PhnG
MAVLVEADATAILARLTALEIPSYDLLREPEEGLVMLRGRMGGDGAPFNFGEATVTRSAVRLPTGETGYGYTLGRDKAKAQAIALCDALLQSEAYASAVDREIIAPLRQEIQEKRSRHARQAAATRVEFFTLIRGED